MMSKRNLSLLEKLQNGKLICGTCITNPNPVWPSIVKACDLDFVFIDTEHIPLDRSVVASMCQSYSLAGIDPIVRISKPDKYRASQTLDDGAAAVVVPYVENYQEVLDLIGAVKYRPLKGVQLEKVLSENKLNDKLEKYLDAYNKDRLCIVNIESTPAVEKLDQLLDYKHVDAVFIGPHDLSVNMGIPEEYDHPLFIETVQSIIRKAREKTYGVAIHFSEDPGRQLYWIDKGVNIVVHSSDLAMFHQRLKADMKVLRGTGNMDIENDTPIIQKI